MIFFILKCAISGILIATASTIARRQPGAGAIIASLPLVSVLGMIWLWLEKPDRQLMARHAFATFWYVLPSLPMFLLIPTLLRAGFPFWFSLAAGCGMTIILYLCTVWCLTRFGSGG